MTPASIITRTAAEGLTLTLTPAGDISAKGNRHTLDRWLPIIRSCKAELLKVLTDDNRCAETLTLPCHVPESRPVPADADIGGMLEVACEGLSITPAQLRRELEENGDLPDVASGELSAHGLRLVAETLAQFVPDEKTSEALSLLAENPGTTHALTSDDESDPDHVLLTLAIRNKATCQLRIARDQYDGLKVLELLNEEANL